MGARAQVMASKSAAGSPSLRQQECAVRLRRAKIKPLAESHPTERARLCTKGHVPLLAAVAGDAQGRVSEVVMSFI